MPRAFFLDNPTVSKEYYRQYDARIFPSVGAELIVNGDLELWTDANDPTGFTAVPTGSSTVNQESAIKHGGLYSCRLDIDSSSHNASIRQGQTNSVGTLFVISGWVYSEDILKFLAIQLGTLQTDGLKTVDVWKEYIWTVYAVNINASIDFKRGSAADASVYWDDLSAKIIDIPSTFGTKRFAPAADNMSIQTNIAVIPGHHIGFWVNVDSTTNPQNGVACFADGDYVWLNKLVGGTWTTLLQSAVTWADGDELKLIKIGTDYAIYHNDFQLGATQTISDAGIKDNVNYVQYSTNQGNLFQNFVYSLANSIPVVPATISVWGGFENGLLSANGWKYLDIFDINRLTRVTNPTRKSKYVARVEVRPGDDVGGWGGDRAEFSTFTDANGDMVWESEASGTQYYGFSIQLSPDWQEPVNIDHTPWGLIFQCHGPVRFGESPVFGIEARAVFLVNITSGDLDLPPVHSNYALSDNSLNLGEWIDFVVKILFKSDTTGTIDIYRRNEGQTNFTNVLSLSGICTLQYKTSEGALDALHYWKAGYYRNHQTTITNILYLDGFTRGTDYNDVIAVAFP